MPYSLIYNNGTATTTYYYVTNLQGDVMYLVDANGVQVAAYDYDPYGRIITATGAMAEINPLRYRGYYYDSETGFYYLQSRYYDPEICRFINADSYACTGRGLIGCNMFAYCNNTPVNYIDIDGYDAVSVLEWWTNQMYWICDADGPYPFCDMVYIGVIIILGVIITANVSTSSEFPQDTSTATESASESATEKIPNVTYPGDDPAKSPGDDYEWRGRDPQGGERGSYYNPKTGECWHPDLNHPQPIGPHWDYKDAEGIWWRIGKWVAVPK